MMVNSTTKIRDLINLLQLFDNQEMNVMIHTRDGVLTDFGGAFKKEITEQNIEDSGDCEYRLGETVLCLYS